MPHGRRVRIAAALGLLSCVLGLRPLHPMHLSMAEVLVDTRAARMTMTVRVFGSDLASAVSSTARASDDSVATRYIMQRVQISDERRRRVPMTSCGVSRRADLVWVCTSVPINSLRSLDITNRVLFELFDDQVNVMQVRNGERRQSMLYRRGSDTHRIQLR